MSAVSQLQGIGQHIGAGNRDALFLEIFSGEVLGKLNNKLMILDTMSTKRALAGAKSALFPVYGDSSASYHTPGEDLLVDGSYADDLHIGDHQITADRVLQSTHFVDDLEEKLAYWDHRSAIAEKMTQAVQEQVEDVLYRLVVKGSDAAQASASASVNGNPLAFADPEDGTDLLQNEWPEGKAEHMSNAFTITKLYDAIWSFAEGLNIRNVSQEGRFFAVRMQDFYNLMRHDTTVTGSVLSGAFNADFGGQSGPLARPQMGFWVGGVFIMPTNLIPTTDNTGSSPAALSGNGNDYRVNMSTAAAATTYVGLGWQREAIGTVRVKEPTVEVTRWPNRLGTQITLSQAMGHNVLRPECCYSIRVAA